MFQDPNQPLINPPIPVVHKIPGGIYPGVIVTIDGVAPSDSFQINFSEGNIIEGRQRSNILFHFNPRFYQRYVARNSFIKGSWEKEEGGQQETFPFKPAIPFHLMILVEDTRYKVAVDGVHFVEFKHRHPLQRIAYLQVYAQVKIHKIAFFRPPGAPVPSGVGLPAAPLQTPAFGAKPEVNGYASVLELFNPPVPFRQPIPYGMRPGTVIYINGRLKPITSRFHFNIEKDDVHRNGEPDVLFHFNPRMDEPMSAVVRNSRMRRSWVNEERDIPGFPFMAGAPCEIMLLCETKRYLVAVNRQHFISFDHRHPIEQGRNLAIEGDFILTSLKITQPPAV